MSSGACSKKPESDRHDIEGTVHSRSQRGYCATVCVLPEQDLKAAENALEAIERGMAFLRKFPFSCRKAAPQNPFLRELLIPFGNSGYVALFEIENSHTVTIPAIRLQREDDYL